MDIYYSNLKPFCVTKLLYKMLIIFAAKVDGLYVIMVICIGNLYMSVLILTARGLVTHLCVSKFGHH